MPWLEIFAVAGIWLTVKGLLRWSRSVLAEDNSPQYRPSSPPTSQKPTLPELDPDRVAHDSVCRWCKTKRPIMLRDSRLETSPWRLTWTCQECGRVARVRVTDEILPKLLELDRVGGMMVSKREAEEFRLMPDAEFEAALRKEIL